MRIAVVGVYKNRMNLAATLKDTKTVVGKLERMIGTLLHAVFVLLYLTIWNVCALACWPPLSVPLRMHVIDAPFMCCTNHMLLLGQDMQIATCLSEWLCNYHAARESRMMQPHQDLPASRC